MTEREYEELLAIEIFKKEEHLDPSDLADFGADDFGWSKLELREQDYYRSLANHLRMWIANTQSPGAGQAVQDPR